MNILDYIKELGLDTLGFTHVAEYADFSYLSTEYYKRADIAVKCELKISKNDGYLILSVSHSNSNDDWVEVKGNSLERKVKILEYLVSVHFEPAIPLLREHKIDSLIL